MSLALFTLINGAELIGKIVGETYDGKTITLEHPLVVRPIQTGPNEFKLNLAPHSLTNPEGEHEINLSQVLSRSKQIPTGLEKAYVERTSAIIIASAMNDLEKMDR